MYMAGFGFYRGSIANSVSILPPRPQALIASYRSPTPNISYWHRPHTSKKELPIVFLHGIGVGLYPYMQLLREVNMGRRHEDGMIGIVAVEMLPISSRISPPLPQKEDMCRQLECVLDSHGFDNFVLVSHSSVTPSLQVEHGDSFDIQIWLGDQCPSIEDSRAWPSNFLSHPCGSRFNTVASTRCGVQLCERCLSCSD
jgi:hypothetical protein